MAVSANLAPSLSQVIDRHKTAVARHALSRPMQCALDDGVIGKADSVFDYGCGRGTDVRLLRKVGQDCNGWDPFHAPDQPKVSADVVNLGYVINVIENRRERDDALIEAFNLARKVLVVAAQLDSTSQSVSAQPFGDGVLTQRRTFQKYFKQEELRNYLSSALGTEPIAATLGVFYVFRDESARQSFLLHQVQRRRTAVVRRMTETVEDRLAPHRELLQRFTRLVESLGRVPRPPEMPELEVIQDLVGTPQRCVRLCEQLFEGFQFEEARRRRRDDLLVYIALSRFQRRPRFSDLPEPVQWDIRDLFGSYTRACELGDELLFRVGESGSIDHACRESKIGKLLPDDLYVHSSVADRLPPVLRVYLGCGRAMVGEVTGANITKIHRFTGKISYLSYPAFDQAPHPPLVRSVVANLRTREICERDYTTSENPPVLHRKETLVDPSYPGYAKFARLSEQEDRAHLLEVPGIGFSKGWLFALRQAGYSLHGHRLKRANAPHDQIGLSSGSTDG